MVLRVRRDRIKTPTTIDTPSIVEHRDGGCLVFEYDFELVFTGASEGLTANGDVKLDSLNM